MDNYSVVHPILTGKQLAVYHVVYLKSDAQYATPVDNVFVEKKPNF
jgi:hypothetical protein